MGENPTRRRGRELEVAIYEAAWLELFERGWSKFTIDGVASRSGTAKSVIYRRWSNRVELVRDMLEQAIAEAEVPFQSSGSLRADLLGFLEGMSEFLQTPYGAAARGVICEGADGSQPSLFEGPAAVLTVASMVEQAVTRGELQHPPSPIAVNLGHALVMYQFLQTGSPPTPSGLADLVDTAWLPALRAPLR
jgi:AcrR family transcriptional regulator